MKRFSRLYQNLDACPFHRDKSVILGAYLSDTPPEEASWVLYLLLGGQLKRAVSPALLQEWILAETGLPVWLFEECREQVGDLSETLSLLAELVRAEAAPAAEPLSLRSWIETRLRPLQDQSAAIQRETLRSWWKTLPLDQSWIVHHLLCGRFQTPVSRRIVEEALAIALEEPREPISQRLANIPLEQLPSGAFFSKAPAQEPEQQALFETPRALPPTQPLSFTSWQEAAFQDFADLGSASDWYVTPVGAGPRAQLITEAGRADLWIHSPAQGGCECVSDRFPEIIQAAATFPSGTLLEGELQPAAWAERRLSRMRPSARQLKSEPVTFAARDLLMTTAEDIRSLPAQRRLALLQELLPASQAFLKPAPAAPCTDWPSLANSSEDQLLRHAFDGRTLLCKAQPRTLDAVLVYVESGYQGLQNANFAVWEDGVLVTLARAKVDGLDPAQFEELDAWVRANVRERFGPVRSVDPVQVFEIAYDGIERSSRHRAGLTLRSPRIVRWKKDARPGDAGRLETLRSTLNSQSASSDNH
jgi:DNA ligase-1